MEAVSLDRSGTQLAAAVYRPRQGGLRPAVLVAPGGLARGDVGAYSWAGERFAAAGYVTMVTTYSAPSPLSDAGDLAAAIDWLLRDPDVDAARLGVFGHSRGGLAALSLAAADARVAAVVAVATPADLAGYIRSVSAFAPAAGAAIAGFMGGMPEDIPAVYEALAARNLAARIHQPVLLMHGAADMRVPVEYAKGLKMALREAGCQDVTLEVLPGVGHFLELATLGYQFDRVIELATAWLTGHLR
jgi:dipeptidyl aminopeptidase/acylaminoacyl peptidase